MQRLREIALTALVWATASSMLLGSMPYYVCRCPDGSIQLHFTGSISPDFSCCSSPCCAREAKEKPCCQAAKNKGIRKTGIRNGMVYHARSAQGPDRNPSVQRTNCQKTLVQPEERSLGRGEVTPTETAPDSLPMLVCITTDLLSATSAATTLWRTDKIPPVTDFITVLQRLTI